MQTVDNTEMRRSTTANGQPVPTPSPEMCIFEQDFAIIFWSRRNLI